MQITSEFMTGAKLFKAPVYQAAVPGALRTALCTKDTAGGFGIQYLQQFSDGHSRPWNLSQSMGTPTMCAEKPAVQRVYNRDELEFMVAYDELDGLTLELLRKLAEPHDRCSFVVTPDELLTLLRGAKNLARNYEYHSNIHNTEQDFRRLAGNSIAIVSFYKMSTFIYDIYGNNPEGIGIAFEILDKHRSADYPSITVGCYILLTNVYEGVFYLDGRSRLNLNGVSFDHKVEYFRGIVEMANQAPKPRAKPKKKKAPSAFGSDPYNNPFEEINPPDDLPEEVSLWEDDFEGGKVDVMSVYKEAHYRNNHEPEVVVNVAVAAPAHRAYAASLKEPKPQGVGKNWRTVKSIQPPDMDFGVHDAPVARPSSRGSEAEQAHGRIMARKAAKKPQSNVIAEDVYRDYAEYHHKAKSKKQFSQEMRNDLLIDEKLAAEMIKASKGIAEDMKQVEKLAKKVGIGFSEEFKTGLTKKVPPPARKTRGLRDYTFDSGTSTTATAYGFSGTSSVFYTNNN